MLKEISFEGGEAGSTTSWPSYRAIDAFEADPSKKWHSGPKDRKTTLPAFIWYDFKSRPICPAKISFRSRQDRLIDNAKDQIPEKYQLVGSNDAVCNENAKWEVLCQDLSGVSITSLADRRFCQVRLEDVIPCQMFRCVGIKVLHVDDEYSRVSLGGIRLWVPASTLLPNW